MDPATDGPTIRVRNASGTGWERRKLLMRNGDSTAWDWVVNAPASTLTWAPRTSFSETINLDTTDVRTFAGTSSEHIKVIGRSSAVDTRRGLFFQGFGSVTIIGGYYRPSSKGQWPSGDIANGGSIYCTECSEVFVEGVTVDNVNVGEYDAVQIVAKTRLTKIVIQNSRLINVQGSETGVHGDIFQTASNTMGRTDYVRMDRVTGTGGYQGFFLDPQEGLNGVHLKNINLRRTQANSQQMYFWFYRETRYAYPVTLENVWSLPDMGESVQANDVWPPSNASSKVDLFSSSKYNAVRATDPATGIAGAHWPGLTDSGKVFSGYVYEGVPPGGDIVPATDSRNGQPWGLGYISPGYSNS